MFHHQSWATVGSSWGFHLKPSQTWPFGAVEQQRNLKKCHLFRKNNSDRRLAIAYGFLWILLESNWTYGTFHLHSGTGWNCFEHFTIEVFARWKPSCQVTIHESGMKLFLGAPWLSHWPHPNLNTLRRTNLRVNKWSHFRPKLGAWSFSVVSRCLTGLSGFPMVNHWFPDFFVRSLPEEGVLMSSFPSRYAPFPTYVPFRFDVVWCYSCWLLVLFCIISWLSLWRHRFIIEENPAHFDLHDLHVNLTGRSPSGATFTLSFFALPSLHLIGKTLPNRGRLALEMADS